MLISRWGNSLAARLPVKLVRELNLKEGDQVDLVPERNGMKVLRRPSAEDVLNSLRDLRGKLPAAERLGRDAANERQVHRHERRAPSSR